MPGPVALDLVARHFKRLALGSQVGVVGHGHLMPGVVIGRLQGEGLEVLIQWCKVGNVDRRHTDQRAEFAQRCILFITCFDFFGGGQLIARFGFENVRASTFALAKHLLVLLELLLESFLLGQGDIDLVLGEQRLGVVFQHPHQQLLALATKIFVGKQRLRDALAISRVGLVVEQRLLQGEAGTVTAVVAVIALVLPALVEVGGLGAVPALVVVVTQSWQQPGAADGTVLKACIAFLDGAEEYRIIVQCLFIDLERSHGRHGLVAREQHQRRPEHRKLFHTAEHPYSSVNAEPARSSSGLNK
ncbi:hypothetical protein D9M69_486370 [compost metagenome]